jgi:hypothetical protein
MPKNKLKLFNSLVEYLVVAGCDQDTGLKIITDDSNYVKVYCK